MEEREGGSNMQRHVNSFGRYGECGTFGDEECHRGLKERQDGHDSAPELQIPLHQFSSYPLLLSSLRLLWQTDLSSHDIEKGRSSKSYSSLSGATRQLQSRNSPVRIAERQQKNDHTDVTKLTEVGFLVS